MSGHGPVLGLWGALADHDLIGDELLAALAGACPGHAKRPAGPQTGHELSLEGAPSLDVERLVDGLMRDPHRLIIGEIDPQPVRDLLGTPGLRPTPISTAPMAATGEAHIGSRHQLAVGSGDLPGETVLHVGAQRVIAGELGDLRAARTPLRVPLRGRHSIRHFVAASRSVAAQLPRDRRRRPTQPSRHRPHPCALGMRDRDLLTFREGQIAARHRSQTDRWHPASLTEPPRPHRLRHPSDTGRVLARHPASDRLPEPDPILTPRRRGPPRRPHLAPHRTNRLLTLANTHNRPPPSRGVATTG